MPISHLNGESRACGATTVVVGQNFVKVDGNLWAVAGDPDTDGEGALINSQSFVTINGIPVILQGDNAAADSLCIPVGGAHCDPYATGGDPLVTVNV